jgi:hypothetical protein
MWPNFTCPNCRASHDLEAEIEEVESAWEDDDKFDVKQEVDESKMSKDNSPSNINHNTTPIRSRQPVDQDGDSPMPDIVSEAPPLQPTVSAPLRAAPPPPPQPESHSNSMSLNHLVDRLVQAESPALSSTSTPPRAIPPRTSARTRQDPLYVHGQGNEGPMTPRNDAGPFVLDGGAGAGRAINPAIESATQHNQARSASHLSISHEGEEVRS